MDNVLFLAAAKVNPGSVGIPTLEADTVINNVLNVVYIAAGITAVIVLVVAGILYSTSNGDPSRTKRAREAIIYAMVGLVVIMSAFIITNFIIGSF